MLQVIETSCKDYLKSITTTTMRTLLRYLGGENREIIIDVIEDAYESAYLAGFDNGVRITEQRYAEGDHDAL